MMLSLSNTCRERMTWEKALADSGINIAHQGQVIQMVLIQKENSTGLISHHLAGSLFRCYSDVLSESFRSSSVLESIGRQPIPTRWI